MIIDLFIRLSFIYNKNIFIDNNHKNPTNSIEIKEFESLFNTVKKNKTILIFEPNKHHHECIPGYCKYFIDLGYNVDILLHICGLDSLCLFKDTRKIRLFAFNNIKQITNFSTNFSSITLLNYVVRNNIYNNLKII